MVRWPSRSPARNRQPPAGFIEPCQPCLYEKVPAGPDWLHELKHDGWRILARKDGEHVRLWSRNAKDWTRAFPGIARAVSALPLDVCLLDGEALAHDEAGWPKFYALRSAVERGLATFMAFDLLAIDGEDLRPWPLIERRARLKDILIGASPELQFSESLENGPALFRHACAMNLEGIVSKRKASPYRSGRFDGWRKIKCPDYARE